MRREAAERERAQVAVDERAVEADRSLERRERHRQQAPLCGVSEHEDVGADAVAGQRRRKLVCAQFEPRAAIERSDDDTSQARGIEVEIPVALEFTGWCNIRVENCSRVAG